MKRAAYATRGPVPQEVIAAEEFEAPKLGEGQVLLEVMAALPPVMLTLLMVFLTMTSLSTTSSTFSVLAEAAAKTLIEGIVHKSLAPPSKPKVDRSRPRKWRLRVAGA